MDLRALRSIFPSRSGQLDAQQATQAAPKTAPTVVDPGCGGAACAGVIDETLKLAATRIASLEAMAPEGEPWTGWRQFEVVNRIEEADHQVTFELRASDGQPIPGYKPGQFLTVALDIQGEREERCYSLSDSPQADVYRITIKRVLSQADGVPAGKVSNFIHDQLGVGTTIDVKTPAGEFVLDMAKTTAAVFLAGGVGVTPFLAMLNMIADMGSQREVHLYYAVNKTSELMRGRELRELAARHPNIKVTFVVSNPAPNEQPGARFDKVGRIGIGTLVETLPKGNYDFFMCGPTPMMAALTEQLISAGVSHRNIHTESFGVAPTKGAGTSPAERARGVEDIAVEVHFVGAGKTLAWDPGKGSLLEAGLAEGIALNSMCRSGSCKGCQCTLESGKVEYPNGDPGVPTGKVLPCVAVPLAGEPVVINETIVRSQA